jgi:hypothetical protein
MQYIKILRKGLNHYDYQWKIGLNEIDVFNTSNECTKDALYICEVKDFFRWMNLYRDIEWVAHATIPEDAQTITMEDKIKTNKVILHEPLIPLVDFIGIAVNNGADINARNNDALSWASERGNLEVVECLIKNGANVNPTSLCI